MSFRAFWNGFFDVRPGEYLRTSLVALYLLFILFAYYILKPISCALFLTSFDIEKLPYLMIMVAVIGGLLVYFYTRLAVKSSLQAAVDWSTALTMVAQGWLERDLKRVMMPLLEKPYRMIETGRHLYGICAKTRETAMREFPRSGDPWLVACAIAAAGELRMRGLAPEIRQAAENTGAEVAEVARSTAALLAA